MLEIIIFSIILILFIVGVGCISSLVLTSRINEELESENRGVKNE